MTITPEQALQIAVTHYNMGRELAESGRWNEAIDAYRRATDLRPELAEAHNNLGIALRAAGRVEEAIISYRRALASRPDFAEVHNNLGIALAQQARWADATTSYRQAAVLRPEWAEVHANLASVLLETGQFDEAIACCERALVLKPNLAKAQQNLGIILLRAGSFERALVHFRCAVACDPGLADAHLNIALIQLLLGRYEEGWREYEWRWNVPGRAGERRRFAVPQWRGAEALGQTILVHAEQGFGDAIQFLRYVPLVRARAKAARVVFECPPSLVRLFAQSGDWNAEILSREGETGAAPQFDQHIPLLSLPLVLEQFAPLPTSEPYLRANSATRATWAERLSRERGLRVGLVWAGSSAHDADRRRSIPFAELLPIMEVPGVQFHSLQIGAGRGSAPLIDPTAHIADFADTAALMMELDLVISVDTAAAHLAGALGRPVWTLLPFVPDWRWGVGREDTPWYSSARLFRQPAPGDWSAVVRRVAEELRAMKR